MSEIIKNQANLEREAKICIHYRSMENDTCKADVRFDQFKELKFWTRPCFGGGGAVCPKYQATRMEAAVKQFEDFNASFKRVEIARNAIVAHTGGRKGVHGSFKCPVCKTGTLSFSIAGYNGHIHASCSTENCVRWME